MEFRILGPLEVREGHVVPLRGARQRALLAMLLLNANEVVSSDRLIEGLWGGEAPPTATTALHVHVSKLRRALEPARERGAPGALVVTRPPGYVIRLQPGQLDLERFEGLVERGRRASAGDMPDAAARDLREALSIWRGAPLADLAFEPFAGAEIPRLEEMRRSALEDRIDADLALGRHSGLVGELHALVTELPLRERLRWQLMLALYRSGRQAEALDAYRAARVALVDRLGIEPSLALRRLHDEILRQDPALEAPRAGWPGAAPDDGSSGARRGFQPALRPATDATDERKLVTVLVAEMAHGGPDGDGDPERTRAREARIRAVVAEGIAAAGGSVDRAHGPLVTAVFGAPSAQEDHAERAVRAALGLRRRPDGGAGLRIGIESGDVVVGAEGEGRLSVVGDAATTAADLAGAAAPGVVLVGGRAMAAVRGVREVGRPLVVPSRRTGRSVRCHALGDEPQRLPARRARGRSAAFVGRESELELLEAIYRRAVGECQPHVVTIVGEPGVGKTRLAGELCERLSREALPPAVLTGHCPAYGHAVTYWPLGEILKEHLDLGDGDLAEPALAGLRGREALGLALAVEPAEEIHPLAARQRFRESWAEFLEELADERPLVLLVEDLHWAKPPLLDLLEEVSRDVGGPLLMLATARPELGSHPARWPAGGRNATTLRLEPLTAAETATMLEELLEAAAPPRLREAILARAEGNPFFVEELTDSLRDRPVAGRDPLATADAGAASKLPDSIKAVIAARIDRLPAGEKAALQTAAVIGASFGATAVAALSGAEPDFGLLEERGFIRRRRGARQHHDREFSFKHALTREVAYASLATPRRARLHAAFAGWLEHAGGGRDEDAALLAHHYAAAVAPRDAELAWEGAGEALERLRAKALAWLPRAARLAVGRYEIDQALALLERALELRPGAAAEADLWRSIGYANALGYQSGRFLEAMAKAIERSGDRRQLAVLYSELAAQTAIRSGMWERRPSQDVVERWIEQALEYAEPRSAARAWALVARSNWTPALAGEASREALAIADRLDDAELLSYAWDARGIAAFLAGRFDEGREWEERRLRAVDRISDPDHVADILHAPLSAYVWRGELEAARELTRRHDEATRSLGVHHHVHGLGIRLELEELAGDWEAVAQLERRARRAVAANTTTCVRNPRSLLVCALAAACRGDDRRARTLERAAGALGMEGYGRALAAPRLRLALIRGEREEAARLAALIPLGQIWHRGWLWLSAAAAQIDALAVIGDRDALDGRAWSRVGAGTYLEPFLLRARAITHGEPELMARAHSRFEAIGLAWHREQTPALEACARAGAATVSGERGRRRA